MSDRHVSVLPTPRPRLVSVGTAKPATVYSQSSIADMLAVPSEGLPRRFFTQSGICTRHLYLEPTPDGAVPDEDQAALLARHRKGGLALGREAIELCLVQAGLDTHDIDYLCCVSSTGMMLPGLSAMYIRHLGFRVDCQRIDIVGMGCNAALNGLNAATGWSIANRGRYALVVCCEINSAIHVRDERLNTYVVNSLFGDGCGAMLVRCDASDADDGPLAAGDGERGSGDGRRGSHVGGRGPEVYGFSSHIVPDAWRAISYHWSQAHNKFELNLDKEIPHVLGEHSPAPISALLERFDLCRCDISHWLVHAGGKKVITAIGEANGLTPHDMRHATSVLRQLGNLGSPTVVFSYEELLQQDEIAPGDYGVMVTMGPGSTIETALLRW